MAFGETDGKATGWAVETYYSDTTFKQTVGEFMELPWFKGRQTRRQHEYEFAT